MWALAGREWTPVITQTATEMCGLNTYEEQRV